MDEKNIVALGTTPWDTLKVGACVLVEGRTGQIVARRYWSAAVRFDGEGDNVWHSVPICTCIELVGGNDGDLQGALRQASEDH